MRLDAAYDITEGSTNDVVMNNCHIQRREEVRALVEDMNLCKLILLPSYSPDYNPLEQAWATVKDYIRLEGDDSPLMAIVRACQGIGPDQASDYFQASGYIV